MQFLKDFYIKQFESLPSTQDFSLENVSSFQKEVLTVVIADSQTKARGRGSNSWHSPKGGLYATFCFENQKNCRFLANVGQIMAISLLSVLKNRGFLSRFKWPNDLLLEGKKVAGILVEVVDDFVFVGVGVNVNTDFSDLQVVDRPTTSLKIENNEEGNIDVLELTKELAKEFISDLNTLFAEGFKSFSYRLKHSSFHKQGDQIRFIASGVVHQGRFDSLNSDGSLSLININGQKEVHYSLDALD